MFVSVIIPTYKDWTRLKLCLDAIAHQSYPKESFEVIVVNNFPNDLSPYKIIADNIRVISESKPGSYAARNAGIRSGKGKIFAFTDSDCIPDTQWLENGVACMEENDADLIGGKVDYYFSNPNSTSELLEAAFYMDNERNIRKHSCAVTANLFVKRTVFDTLGPFVSHVKSGGDIEFTKRATSNGYNLLFCANAIILHPTRNFQQKIKRTFRVGKGLLFVEVSRTASCSQKMKMILLHLIPLANPLRVVNFLKERQRFTILDFAKMMLLSLVFGMVKATGFIISILYLPAKYFNSPKYSNKN